MSTALIVAAPGHAEGADPAACRTTAEQCDLKAASSAARAYALTDAGVAILIHLGGDIPNPHIQTAEQLGDYFVRRFAEHNTEARYFIRQNDVFNTGVTYYYADLIVGMEDGTEVRPLGDALSTIKQAADAWHIHDQFKDAIDHIDLPAPNRYR